MSAARVTVAGMSAIGFEVSEPLLAPVAPDPTQRAVLELPDDVSAAVLGAPGTGKTTTIVELVADRVLERGWDPGELLVLTASRASATRLRDRLAIRLGRPTDGPLARTVLSIAHEIAALTASPGEEPPRLLSGAEEDADIAALLAGHLESGSGPDWPDPLTPDVRRMRGFRSELRDLHARATELGIPPHEVAALGRRTGRPEWVAAGEFLAEYLDVVAAARPAQLGGAELLRLATAIVADGDGGERVARLRLLVVDDLQEATEGVLGLLAAFARRGIAIVGFGDPDVAVNTFRGGEPDALGRFGAVLGIPHARRLTLGTVHRQPAGLRSLTAAVTARIGTAAAGTQRRATPVRSNDDPATSDVAASGAATAATSGARWNDRPALARIEAPTPAREWAAIARVLREEHLRHDVPWRRLAVVLRSGALVPTVARALAAAEVPTRTGGAGVPLRDDAAARALVAVVEVAIGRRPLTPESASELLLGPFGGLDAVGLRRLRVALRTEEFAGGGTRPAGELLVEALAAPGRFTTIDARVARVAERLAGTLAAIREAAGSSAIEELLWIAWERSGLARSWRERALGTGIGAAEANRDLDGIVALFAAATRFSERRPDLPAAEFLAELLDTDVPDDLIAPSAAGDSVLVTTPAGLVGLEFDSVVVAGLQEGVWPNLRPRSTLLAAPELGRAAVGEDAPLDARRSVLDDELRMFALAVSRARERVVLAAVANDDETPSPLLGFAPDAPVLPDAGVPLTLRGLTGRLRRSLTARGTEPATRSAAASTLARLAELDVPGAHPDDWHGLRAPSTTAPLFEGEAVAISPSRLQRFEESPLDWFLETVAGSTATTSMTVGTLLHAAMETADEPTLEAVWRTVESRWPELVFEAEWMSEHHRRAARRLAGAIAEYLRDFAGSGGSLVGAERRFELELDDVVVRGSIDRVERGPDGEVVIIDLKTGTPVTKQAEIDAHPQLGAYQLAYRSGVLDAALAEHGEHRPGGAKLLFVKEGVRGRPYREAVQAALDEEALEAFRARIRAAAAGMRATEFDAPLELRAYGLGNVAELRLHRAGAVSGD